MSAGLILHGGEHSADAPVGVTPPVGGQTEGDTETTAGFASARGSVKGQGLGAGGGSWGGKGLQKKQKPQEVDTRESPA